MRQVLFEQTDLDATHWDHTNNEMGVAWRQITWFWKASLKRLILGSAYIRKMALQSYEVLVQPIGQHFHRIIPANYYDDKGNTLKN
jgi:hypothetical protein